MRGFFICAAACLLKLLAALSKEEAKAIVDEVALSFLSRASVPSLSVGISWIDADNNEITTVSAYNNFSETSLSQQSLWPLGSASSVLTAFTYYHMLGQSGSKVPGLDDDVLAWLKDHGTELDIRGSYKNDLLTTRMLLTRTSGFQVTRFGRRRRSHTELGSTAAEAMKDYRIWRSRKSGILPGESEVDGALLALIVELAGEKPFTEIVQQVLSEVAPGIRVVWFNSEISDEDRQLIPMGHIGWQNATLVTSNYATPALRLWPARGALMTTSDILKFLRVLSNSIGTEPYKKMTNADEGFVGAVSVDSKTGAAPVTAPVQFASFLGTAFINGELWLTLQYSDDGTSLGLLIEGRTGGTVLVIAGDMSPSLTSSDRQSTAMDSLPYHFAARMGDIFPAVEGDIPLNVTNVDGLYCPVRPVGILGRTWYLASTDITTPYQLDSLDYIRFSDWNGPVDKNQSAREVMDWAASFMSFDNSIASMAVVTQVGDCGVIWSANQSIDGRITGYVTSQRFAKLGPHISDERKDQNPDFLNRSDLMLINNEGFTSVTPLAVVGTRLTWITRIAVYIAVAALLLISITMGNLTKAPRGQMSLNTNAVTAVSPDSARSLLAQRSRGLRRLFTLKVVHAFMWGFTLVGLLVDVVILEMIVSSLNSMDAELPYVHTYEFGCHGVPVILYPLYIAGIVIGGVSVFGCLLWIVLYSAYDYSWIIICSIFSVLVFTLFHLCLGFIGASTQIC